MPELREANRLRIETPEGLVFALPLADPFVRLAALCIDLAAIQLLLTLLMIGVSILAGLHLEIAIVVYLLSYFGLTIGYPMLLEALWNGQTIGKRLMHLRVVDATGLPLTGTQIILRNILRFADALPAFYLLGGAVLFFSPRNQRLGDHAAGTVVVSIERHNPTGIEGITAGKYNTFRDYPHLCARLRQRISPAEAALGLQALLRRKELDDDSRFALYEQLAEHFRHQSAFPDQATNHLTPEQFLRNCIDICYQ